MAISGSVEIIWECQDCDVKLVSVNGKRQFSTNQGIKPYTKSWGRYLVNARACNHEHKVWSDHYCRVCGKRLSNPKSIEREMGHVCYSKTEKARLDMAITKESRERHFDHEGKPIEALVKIEECKPTHVFDVQFGQWFVSNSHGLHLHPHLDEAKE